MVFFRENFSVRNFFGNEKIARYNFFRSGWPIAFPVAL